MCRAYFVLNAKKSVVAIVHFYLQLLEMLSVSGLFVHATSSACA